MSENKWIRFQKTGDTGKTERKYVLSPRAIPWEVVNSSSSAAIARILWYGPWRQYILVPANNTVWNDGCLESVIAFLKKLNAEHKAKVTAHSQVGR